MASRNETPEETEVWARELIAAISDDEVRQILSDYRSIASDRKVTKSGRAIAKQRAEILERRV